MKTAYELLKEIGFVRVSTTPEELKAAEIIKTSVEALGLEAKIETFPTQWAEIQEVSFEVTKPYQKKYNATAYQCGADCDGLVAPLLYFEDDTEVMKKQAKGKFLLVNGTAGHAGYKKFARTGCVGFITFNGNIDYTEKVDLDQKEFRPPLHEYGDMPGINLKVEDAMEMINLQASEVKVTIKQQRSTADSYNVICEIPGWEDDEAVICSAHFDTVPHSKGYWDNGTGSVCLYGMAQYFAKNQPRHTVRLVWCGSEERGCFGSEADCKMHPDEVEKARLNVNIDMIGSVLGRRFAAVTGPESLVHFIDYYGKEIGFPIRSSQRVASSDSTSFADVGIPAVSIGRGGNMQGGTIHSCLDVLEHVNERLMNEDIDFITSFTAKMANAYIIPVPKEIPQNMKAEIDQFYCREPKK